VITSQLLSITETTISDAEKEDKYVIGECCRPEAFNNVKINGTGTTNDGYQYNFKFTINEKAMTKEELETGFDRSKYIQKDCPSDMVFCYKHTVQMLSSEEKEEIVKKGEEL
jgi:hypothetical protein